MPLKPSRSRSELNIAAMISKTTSSVSVNKDDVSETSGAPSRALSRSTSFADLAEPDTAEMDDTLDLGDLRELEQEQIRERSRGLIKKEKSASFMRATSSSHLLTKDKANKAPASQTKALTTQELFMNASNWISKKKPKEEDIMKKWGGKWKQVLAVAKKKTDKQLEKDPDAVDLSFDFDESDEDLDFEVEDEMIDDIEKYLAKLENSDTSVGDKFESNRRTIERWKRHIRQVRLLSMATKAFSGKRAKPTEEAVNARIKAAFGRKGINGASDEKKKDSAPAPASPAKPPRPPAPQPPTQANTTALFGGDPIRRSSSQSDRSVASAEADASILSGLPTGSGTPNMNAEREKSDQGPDEEKKGEDKLSWEDQLKKEREEREAHAASERLKRLEAQREEERKKFLEEREAAIRAQKEAKEKAERERQEREDEMRREEEERNRKAAEAARRKALAEQKQKDAKAKAYAEAKAKIEAEEKMKERKRRLAESFKKRQERERQQKENAERLKEQEARKRKKERAERAAQKKRDAEEAARRHAERAATRERNSVAGTILRTSSSRNLLKRTSSGSARGDDDDDDDDDDHDDHDDEQQQQRQQQQTRRRPASASYAGRGGVNDSDDGAAGELYLGQPRASHSTPGERRRPASSYTRRGGAMGSGSGRRRSHEEEPQALYRTRSHQEGYSNSLLDSESGVSLTMGTARAQPRPFRRVQSFSALNSHQPVDPPRTLRRVLSSWISESVNGDAASQEEPNARSRNRGKMSETQSGRAAARMQSRALGRSASGTVQRTSSRGHIPRAPPTKPSSVPTQRRRRGNGDPGVSRASRLRQTASNSVLSRGGRDEGSGNGVARRSQSSRDVVDPIQVTIERSSRGPSAQYRRWTSLIRGHELDGIAEVRWNASDIESLVTLPEDVALLEGPSCRGELALKFNTAISQLEVLWLGLQFPPEPASLFRYQYFRPCHESNYAILRDEIRSFSRYHALTLSILSLALKQEQVLNDLEATERRSVTATTRQASTSRYHDLVQMLSELQDELKTALVHWGAFFPWKTEFVFDGHPLRFTHDDGAVSRQISFVSHLSQRSSPTHPSMLASTHSPSARRAQYHRAAAASSKTNSKSYLFG